MWRPNPLHSGSFCITKFRENPYPYIEQMGLIDLPIRGPQIASVRESGNSYLRVTRLSRDPIIGKATTIV